MLKKGCAGFASSANIDFGVDPPEIATRATPLLATTLETVSANNFAAASAGLSSPTLTFIGTPDQIALGSSATTIQYALQASSGIETIANFQYGLDQLNIDLLGAASGVLQASDTSLNGTSAISLYSSAAPTHGVVFTAGGTSNITTATDLMTNHLFVSNGHALIS